VTVSGVSLTVNRVSGDAFHVVLVPRTLLATKLGTLVVGASVNLEVDLLARYCERLLRGAPPGEAGEAGDADAAWMARLRAGGWA
jgi:riboflavin synthase